jgi:hypothetical protein
MSDRPRLMTKLTPEMQERVEEIRKQADPNMIGEIENGALMGKPIEPMKFERYDRPRYWAEIGTKGADLIYHFFPLEGQNFPEGFADKMGDAFFEVFKQPDKLEAAVSQELNSWAVRVRGANHILLDLSVPIRVLEVLDQKL